MAAGMCAELHRVEAEKEMVRLRLRTRTGRPLGSERFVEGLVKDSPSAHTCPWRIETAVGG